MSEIPTLIIERQKHVVGKIRGRGRKKGNGSNIRLLNKLKAGDSIWDVPMNKMFSIKTTALREGLSLRIRRLPGNNNLFAIERLP